MSLPAYVPPQKMEILFSHQQIAERVHALGTQISADYVGESIVLIGVLKGAAIFISDLARSITVDNTFDFVAVSSYGRARVSSGQVKLIKDIDNPIEDKHVILVEDIDILDTGLTMTYLRQLMLQHKPASLKIATCLDKHERRLVPIEADYVCFKIPDKFVVGYGMDFAGQLSRDRGHPDLSGHACRSLGRLSSLQQMPKISSRHRYTALVSPCLLPSKSFQWRRRCRDHGDTAVQKNNCSAVRSHRP